jgi:hypothetical protein
MRQYLRIDKDGKAVWSATKAESKKRAFEPDVVTDSLGCTKWDVEEKREDARRAGFNVEFVEDRGPSATEGFYPCKGTPKEMARYERYRKGCEAERNSGGGNIIDGAHIEAMRRKILEQYPIGDGK